MLKIPENTRYDLNIYKRFYNVLLLKKLLYKYDLITSLRIVSQNITLFSLKNWIKIYLPYVSDIEFTDEIYQKIKENHKYNLHTKHKLKTFKKRSKEYKDSIVLKCKQTKLERYGDPNYNNFEQTKKKLNYKEIGIKQKQTKLEKYGTLNFKDKIKQTNLEKYGDENYVNWDLIRKNNLEKYGVEIYNNIEKIQKTKLERYGDPNYNNIEKIKESLKLVDYDEVNSRIKQIKLERYNDENYNNIEKIKESLIKKFGIHHFKKHIKNIDDLVSEEFWINKSDELNRVSKSEILDYFNISNNTYSKYKPNYILSKKKFGNLESQFLFDVEKEYNIRLEKQFKIVFDENIYYIVDGFDKSSNTIYEFLGDFWHGRLNNDEINTVRNKTFKELYDETFNKFKNLKKLEYKIKYIWESDYLDSGLEFLRNYNI